MSKPYTHFEEEVHYFGQYVKSRKNSNEKKRKKEKETYILLTFSQ